MSSRYVVDQLAKPVVNYGAMATELEGHISRMELFLERMRIKGQVRKEVEAAIAHAWSAFYRLREAQITDNERNPSWKALPISRKACGLCTCPVT